MRIMSRMVATSWPRRCLVAHWTCTIEAELLSTRLGTGMAFCTPSRGSRARRITQATTSVIRRSNPLLLMAVRLARILARIRPAWMQFMILWITRPTCATKASLLAKGNGCEACGLLCALANEAGIGGVFVLYIQPLPLLELPGVV